MMAKKKKDTPSEGPLIQNKQAYRNFEILEKLEVGVVLLGSEVKSIREGGMNLADSYVRFVSGELYLVGCHIKPYSHVALDAPKPVRDRKLLLHAKEIEKLSVQVTRKGLTLLALKVYFKNGRCKIELGVGRGKKLHDKREDIKAREAKRDIERVLKGRRHS